MKKLIGFTSEQSQCSFESREKLYLPPRGVIVRVYGSKSLELGMSYAGGSCRGAQTIMSDGAAVETMVVEVVWG